MAAALSKKTSATGPCVMRRMVGRMKQMQDELVLESVTNIEFEEASRRSLDHLQGQITSLKEAFNKLTDTLLEEMDLISTKVDGKANRSEEQKTSLEASLVRDISEASAKSKQLEESTTKLSRDVGVVLKMIPRLDNKIDTSLNEMARVTDSVTEHLRSEVPQKALDATGRLEARMKSLEAELRADFEQRHLKLQKSITRQLENMSKALVMDEPPHSRRVDFDIPAVLANTRSPTISSRSSSAYGSSSMRGCTQSSKEAVRDGEPNKHDGCRSRDELDYSVVGGGSAPSSARMNSLRTLRFSEPPATF